VALAVRRLEDFRAFKEDHVEIPAEDVGRKYNSKFRPLNVHCTALSAFRCCAVVTRSRVTYNQCHNPSGAHSFGILIIVKGLHNAKSGFRTA
jgi:hypothetical protein